MKPIEDLSTMPTLDFTPRFANGDMTVPLCLQARALFLQEDISEQSQGPETHDGRGAHQLILIQAQFLFAITKEDLNVPSRCDVRQEPVWTGLQITGCPVASLGDRRIQGPTHDHDLTLVQAAHPRRHHMHVYRLLAFWPAELNIVA